MTYNQLTTKDFIEKARKIHGEKYDYSKVEYKNNHTKVCIICPKHGEFWQMPSSHLSRRGCKECYREKLANLKLSSTQEFIIKAKEIHKNEFDYSKTIYKDSQTNVCIICPKHGEFWQTPNNHLRGAKCPQCYQERRGVSQRLTTKDFIDKAIQIHNHTYDYSKVNYVNCSTKVCIICPKHGEFWQRPDAHLTNKCGCPKCKASHIENEIAQFLIKHKIEFIRQQTFPWLINDTNKTHQYLDFYLPKYNLGIEIQGEQHFIPIKRYGGEKELLKIKWLDENKYQKCITNNLNLLYFGNAKYKEKMKGKMFFSKKNDLLKIIKG